MVRRRRDRERYWRDVLRRQKKSGLNVASFCRQESISSPSFYSWRRKLQERKAGRAEDDAGENASHAVAQLLPVQIEAALSPVVPVRILLPQGASIEAAGNIDRRALVELLGALREAQLC